MSTDAYASALESDDYKAWKGEEVEAPKADDPPKEEAPKEEAEQPRGEDGKFLPKENGGSPKPAAEPFEGFGSLDPAIQAQFNRVLSERDDYRTRYTRQLGHTRQLARSAHAAPSGPVGDQLAAAQRHVSGMAPGAQRQAAQKQLDKWEAHLSQYPDDAAAIEQRLSALRDDLASGITPLVQEVQSLRSIVSELHNGFGAVQQERAERMAQEHQATLDTIADNWRQIAGWQDDEGRLVPPEQRQWHPEFVAWVDGHDPDVQEHIWATLNHASPRVAGSIFAQFNRDAFAASAPSTPANPTASRRAEALRDTQPNSGRARTTGAATFTPSGDPYVDALHTDAYAAWRQA